MPASRSAIIMTEGYDTYEAWIVPATPRRHVRSAPWPTRPSDDARGM